jgi:putative addiction module component (TIGR02574 family)
MLGKFLKMHWLCLLRLVRPLADSLWESLEGQSDEGAEGAWRKEIERRVRDLDSGTVVTIPWTEVRTRLLTKLSE